MVLLAQGLDIQISHCREFHTESIGGIRVCFGQGKPELERTKSWNVFVPYYQGPTTKRFIQTITQHFCRNNFFRESRLFPRVAPFSTSRANLVAPRAFESRLALLSRYSLAAPIRLSQLYAVLFRLQLFHIRKGRRVLKQLIILSPFLS